MPCIRLCHSCLVLKPYKPVCSVVRCSVPHCSLVIDPQIREVLLIFFLWFHFSIPYDWDMPCRREIVRRFVVLRPSLALSGAGSYGVNNETIVACLTRSFPARPHSLWNSACLRDGHARGCASARPFPHSRRLFYSGHPSFSRQLKLSLFRHGTNADDSEPPQVLQLQVHTSKKQHTRFAAVASDG